MWQPLVKCKFADPLYIKWSNYIFFGLSGISAVFPVFRVFPVNLGTHCYKLRPKNW